jgi:G3E family GTPase
MTTPSKIPVIVLTGFLGSGKTTLLNRLLTDGIKTAVIINEFGSTPVDQDLLQDQAISMTVLSGGCLCCQIKGALAPTLKNLWMAWNGAAEKSFDRLIIETSGIASPEPILDTLLREPWIAKRYALRQVVATLAIPSARDQLDRHAEARAQVVWYSNELVRIKGIVYSPESPEAWAIHAAGGRLYPPVSLPVRPNQDRRSRLILITAFGLELLTQELSIRLGSSLDQNAIRLH